MKITLVLCATKSNHNYQGMKTFVDLADNVILYDTGMTNEESNTIKNMFKDKSVIHVKKTFTNFSTLRNDAISYAQDTDWIIMPDDSWEIHGVDRSLLFKLLKYDIIQISLKLIEEQFIQEQKVMRIFKKTAKFK